MFPPQGRLCVKIVDYGDSAIAGVRNSCEVVLNDVFVGLRRKVDSPVGNRPGYDSDCLASFFRN